MNARSSVKHAGQLAARSVDLIYTAEQADCSKPLVREKYGKARTLGEDHIAAAIRHIRETSHSPESDEVKFLLSVRSGLRAAEIAGLKLADLLDADDKVGSLVRVSRHIGKGRKERVVPMHPQLKEALVRLQAAFPEARHVSFSKWRISRVQSDEAVKHWFARLYAELGLAGCSSHSGRRTFITNLAQTANKEGCSLRDVQQLAGHSRLESTAAYIELSANLRKLVASLGRVALRAV